MNADLQGVGITEYSYLLLISELVQLGLAVALLYFGIGLRKRVQVPGTWFIATAGLFILRAAMDLLDPLLPRNRLLFNLVDDVVIIAALACLLLAVMALVAHWRETPEGT